MASFNEHVSANIPIEITELYRFPRLDVGILSTQEEDLEHIATLSGFVDSTINEVFTR